MKIFIIKHFQQINLHEDKQSNNLPTTVKLRIRQVESTLRYAVTQQQL